MVLLVPSGCSDGGSGLSIRALVKVVYWRLTDGRRGSQPMNRPSAKLYHGRNGILLQFAVGLLSLRTRLVPKSTTL